MGFRFYVGRRKIVTYGVAAFALGLALGALLLNLPSLDNSKPAAEQSITLLSSKMGTGAFSAILPAMTYQINATQYLLPVDLTSVEYYANLRDWLNITSAQEQLLSQNGFVALRLSSYGNLSEFYDYAYTTGMPMLITTDVVLHYYHVLFDNILKGIETNEFMDDLNGTINTLLDQARIDAQSMIGTPLENASRLNLMYLEVAHALMQPSFTPTTAEANQEVQLVLSHNSVADSPIFGFGEDYTQYVPRGHYTESEQLEQYFRAMMWFGRMRFQLLRDSALGSTFDLLQTRAAALLTWMVTGNESVYNAWQKIYTTTEFFVGASDDLTFQDYLTVLNQKGISAPEQLSSDAAVADVAQALLDRNRSQIQSDPVLAGSLEEALNKTAGLRFMGQRFTPDSYIFQQLIDPQVPSRMLPMGLDVPAVLGSNLARQLLNETEAAYPGYTQQMDKLATEFGALNMANWTQNLYWAWLYTANTTLAHVPSEANYPTFMTTPSWNYEKLQTFEGTWTELRHDTILYAKMSMTSGVIFPPSNTAYVEPYPETYRAIVGLANMTINGLTQLGIFSANLTYPYTWATPYQAFLTTFMNYNQLFLNASLVELQGKTLDPNLQNQIRDAAHRAFTTVLNDLQPQSSAIVADVSTDLELGRVLEEAVGNFSVLVIVYSNPDGSLYSAAGPVFSYYEFTTSIDNRLTDEEWRTMLAANQTVQPPEWTSNFTR